MGFIFSVILTLLINYVISEKVLICYYGTWATYRWGDGKFDVENVNPTLCTHLVYAFVGIDTNGNVKSLDPGLDYDNGNFEKFNALKQQNPKLKTLLAVGGWNEGSAKYSSMAAIPALRQNFIQSAIKMILDYGFDGFDIDWEYPGGRDTIYGVADVNNFSVLLKELKEEFSKYGLLLTAAVAAVESTASQYYDVQEISKHLDFINLMTYDLHGAWDPLTGHNAQLFAGEGDENANNTALLTVENAVQYWLREGCPPEKLVIGLPIYGRSFTLTSAANSRVKAPSVGAGIGGPYTVTSGSLGYNEFCYMLKTQTWDVRYDSLAKVPYAVLDRNWVSFDDPNSITQKVEYGLKYNVAGFMVWSIETDDFHGLCVNEDFPILRAINKAKDAGGDSQEAENAPNSTQAPETETSETFPVPETTTSPEEEEEETSESTTTVTGDVEESDVICKDQGFTSDPHDCAVFYMCILSVDSSLVPIKFVCPQNLFWDPVKQTCNYPELVDCSTMIQFDLS